MEKAHSPYNKESSTSSSNSDFHRHNSHSHSHHHHNHTSSGNNSSNNNYNNINRDKSRKSSISPSNLSVKSDDGRCKSKSPHHHHSHYHNHHQHSHPQTSTTVANGTGNYNNGSKTSSSSGHYSPSGSATNNSNTSNTVPNNANNGPLTKNVGVGSNLSTTTSGRHSSASVSVGHRTLGSINGPATVSISTGLNNGLNGNLISPGSNNSNSSCGSGFGSNGNLSNSNGNNNGSGRTSNTAGALNLNRETSVGSQRHPSPVIQSHSPSLIPSTILPELLQAHAAAAAGTLGGQSGGGSSCTTSSSTSSSSSNNNNNIASSSRGPTAVALAAGGTISNPNSTTKVVGNQPTSPVRQGIPLRHQRGEMINGSSSTTSKIVSQNVNGTLALTGIPRTDSELQLFRVLQRANLLTYFDVMIELGGDDVQQLYEAGVDEFLEIMTLIGMAHKPLHVRRLQKALQEWMSNPALFQTPVLPPGVFGQNPHGSGMLTPSPPLAITARPTPLAITSGPNQSIMPIPVTSASLPTSSHTNQSNMGTNLPIRPIPYHSVPSAAAAMAAAAAAQQAMFLSPSEMKSLQNKLQVMTNGQGGSGGRSNSNSPNNNNGSSSATVVGSSGLGVRNSHLSPNSSSSVGGPTNHSFSNGYHHHPPRSQERLEREIIKEKEAQQQQLQHHIAAMGGNGSLRIPADQINPSHFLEQRIRTTSEPNSPGASESAESGHSLSPVPFLQEMEIQKLSDTAITIIKTLPPYVFEPVVPSKRKFSGDFELIMRLPLNDPRRIDEIRKMSTIYGRADSYSSTHPNKRKFPKPLTMHEVSVNEAAAQLCKHVPALLTRWSELTALAKHVVRDAGLPYSNNNFSISLIQNNNNNNFANHNLKYHKTSQQQNPIELNHIYNNNDHRGEPINGSLGGGFSSKKLRMDNNNGLEIQEYNRPPSNGSDSVQMDIHDNAMQITPIRNLPRRSPSDDHSPLPLELVTVTTSSPRRSSDSGSPPSSLRRSTESDDLMNGFKISSHSPSVKITSIPVNGINHDSNNGSSSPLKLLPIKTEPAN